jgi:hypothetical protein
MQLIEISSPIWSIVKIFFCVGLGVYVVFALVVFRQIQIMSETVKLKLEMAIKILAFIHLLFALLLLVLAIITL